MLHTHGINPHKRRESVIDKVKSIGTASDLEMNNTTSKRNTRQQPKRGEELQPNSIYHINAESHPQVKACPHTKSNFTSGQGLAKNLQINHGAIMKS